MKTRKTANIIINLIEEKYESDAVFERALGVPPKTVNNWKRGTSAGNHGVGHVLAQHGNENDDEGR